MIGLLRKRTYLRPNELKSHYDVVIIGGAESALDRLWESKARQQLASLLLLPVNFRARLLELALGDLQFAGDHFQVALKIRVGLLVLGDAVLQGRHILLNRLFHGFYLGRDRLLRAFQFR